MPWNPAAKHMEKIDDWGSQQATRLRQQLDAGHGVSVQERINLARGKGDGTSSTGSGFTEGKSRMTAPPIRASNKPGPSPSSVPPPPPQRKVASGSSPSVSQNTDTPPPPLPRRTGTGDNESKKSSNSSISSIRPVPSPRPSSQSKRVSTPTTDPASGHEPHSGGYIEFSKFTDTDKESFFKALDEYFDSRRTHTETSIQPPSKKGNYIKQQSEEAWCSLSRDQESCLPTNMEKSDEDKYPILSASARHSSELCSALEAATFFVYPSHYDEWTRSHPWFLNWSQAAPHLSLTVRSDVALSFSHFYQGPLKTVLGAALFSDLSALWYRITYNDSNPNTSFRCEVCYSNPPTPWDYVRLQEAALTTGEHIARFAENAAVKSQWIGNGECWTLASDAIKDANHRLVRNEEDHLLESIGRTHGHLLYAGKAHPVMTGRWRGGDRDCTAGGGIRRGDIIEWKSGRCRLLDAPSGSYTIIGDPSGSGEHTSVVVEDSPLPPRLAQAQDEQPEVAPWEFGTLTVVEQSVDHPCKRNKYDFSPQSFTQGELWIYRPCSQKEYIGGKVVAKWPPSIPGTEQIA